MVPKAGDVRQIIVDGKTTGIKGLGLILEQVSEMEFFGPVQVKEALLTAVKAANYVPTKKTEAYGDALYGEYLHYIESRG